MLLTEVGQLASGLLKKNAVGLIKVKEILQVSDMEGRKYKYLGFLYNSLGPQYIKACWYEKVKVKVAQSCLTLYDPMDYTVHGILQARIQPFLSPGDLPNLGIELSSPAL